MRSYPKTSVKGYEATLRDLNYKHYWKRIKSGEVPEVPEYRSANKTDLHQILLDNTKRPLCQNVDIIFPTGQDEQSAMYTKFMNMLGDRCPEQDPNSLGSVHAKSESENLAELDEITYENNDEQRYFHVQQFIDTEANYVNTLKPLVELIVNKLNPDNFQSRHESPIIDRFQYKSIFLNIEEILKANECFMSDLRKCNTGAADDMCFGEVCASHMANFACYRNYSLGFEQGRRLHATEFKNNGHYRRFLESTLADPKFNRRRMHDVLIEPTQRLTRYILMIKDILKYTPPRHRDYEPLKRAYVKACSIASMEDDDATKLATTCHNIFQSFKNPSCLAPHNLISQNRSFIAHLDAIEIHRTKGYQKRPVTFFLFTDKILIAERPNYQCRGIDLLDSKNRDKLGMLTLKRDQKLRFKGWIDIEQAQIFEGAPDTPNSFLLFASTLQKHGRGPVPTTESQEDFFRKGFRLFTVPPREDDESDDCLSRTVEFVTKFQHGQALAKRYDPNDEAYHRQWCDLNVYSNIYDTVSYTRANYKNNIAVVYLEEGKSVNLRSLFPGVTPWIVALVQGTSGGFRFSTWSKVELPLKKDILDSISWDSVTEDGKNFIFESVFWNNVFLCERHLRASEEFIHAHQDDLDAKPRGRSRSRSLTRSTSIPSLTGWFNQSNSRSRSMSPSRGSVKPTSSRSSPIGTQGLLTFAKKSRSRSSSMTSSSSGTLARSLTSHSSSSLEQQRPAKMTQRKSLPTALNLSSEPILPKPIVSSPQDDYDLMNKYADSRPSSRSSTRSSTSSFAFNHAFGGGPFSNPISLASHSTRSSLSLEDLEFAKHSPSPPPRVPESNDDFKHKVQQLLGTSKKMRSVPFNPRDERPNGFVVSSVGMASGSGDHSTQIIDRCRKLTEQLTQVSNSAQSRPVDSEYNVHFNNGLEEIMNSINSYRNERRSSQTSASASHNAESFFARKVKEAQAQRESFDRSMSDLQNRMVEFGRQQSTM